MRPRDCFIDHTQMYWTLIAVFNPSGNPLDYVVCPVCDVKLETVAEYPSLNDRKDDE